MCTTGQAAILCRYVTRGSSRCHGTGPADRRSHVGVRAGVALSGTPGLRPDQPLLTISDESRFLWRNSRTDGALYSGSSSITDILCEKPCLTRPSVHGRFLNRPWKSNPQPNGPRSLTRFAVLTQKSGHVSPN